MAHPNGAVVPVDEPAVAARKAEHLAALGAVHAAPAYAAAVPALTAAAPAAYAAAPAAYAAAPVAYSTAYAGPLNLNTQLVAHPNGAVVPGENDNLYARTVPVSSSIIIKHTETRDSNL